MGLTATNQTKPAKDTPKSKKTPTKFQVFIKESKKILAIKNKIRSLESKMTEYQENGDFSNYSKCLNKLEKLEPNISNKTKEQRLKADDELALEAAKKGWIR
jgi:hypothetical protein